MSSEQTDHHHMNDAELNGLGLNLPESFGAEDPFLKVGSVSVKDVSSSLSHANETPDVERSMHIEPSAVLRSTWSPDTAASMSDDEESPASEAIMSLPRTFTARPTRATSISDCSNHNISTHTVQMAATSHLVPHPLLHILSPKEHLISDVALSSNEELLDAVSDWGWLVPMVEEGQKQSKATATFPVLERCLSSGGSSNGEKYSETEKSPASPNSTNNALNFRSANFSFSSTIKTRASSRGSTTITTPDQNRRSRVSATTTATSYQTSPECSLKCSRRLSETLQKSDKEQHDEQQQAQKSRRRSFNPSCQFFGRRENFMNSRVSIGSANQVSKKSEEVAVGQSATTSITADRVSPSLEDQCDDEEKKSSNFEDTGSTETENQSDVTVRILRRNDEDNVSENDNDTDETAVGTPLESQGNGIVQPPPEYSPASNPTSPVFEVQALQTPRLSNYNYSPRLEFARFCREEVQERQQYLDEEDRKRKRGKMSKWFSGLFQKNKKKNSRDLDEMYANDTNMSSRSVIGHEYAIAWS